MFKVNNQYAGKLSSTSTAFGYNALNSVTALQGAGNTAIGVSSMALTTSTGMYNTALGGNTLANNTTVLKILQLDIIPVILLQQAVITLQ